MSQLIFLIGPRATIIEMQRCIDEDSPELIIFIDAAVQLRNELKFNCAHYSLGDADGGGNYRELLDELHPAQKDESDLALALKFIEKDIHPQAEIHAFGLWGGRFDHQLANMGEFLRLSGHYPKIRIIWHGENKEEKAYIACGETDFNHEGLFSVFTLQDNEISIEGEIEYPLAKQSLAALSSLGLSNVARGAFSIHALKPYLIIFAD